MCLWYYWLHVPASTFWLRAELCSCVWINKRLQQRRFWLNRIPLILTVCLVSKKSDETCVRSGRSLWNTPVVYHSPPLSWRSINFYISVFVLFVLHQHETVFNSISRELVVSLKLGLYMCNFAVNLPGLYHRLTRSDLTTHTLWTTSQPPASYGK